METLKASEKNIASRFNNKIHYQLPPEVLVEQTIILGQGKLNSSGALCVNTGKFTGRSPKDKAIVIDNLTTDTVGWGDVNAPFPEALFSPLKEKMLDYLSDKEVWIRDAYACADQNYRLKIKVINETPWANLFCHHLFLRDQVEHNGKNDQEWLIIQAPDFHANPDVDGTRQSNFTIVSFSEKTILIGGSAYTGEMKKGIFSVLNFLLPQNHKVLSMHCSANEGKSGDVALFFGLSGTGKTTLSADASRALIGDDEHGWSANGIFNFEGGCYAKAVGLDPLKEPEIFGAIRPNTLLENVVMDEQTGQVDFNDISITENTRIAYPIDFIDNAKEPSFGGQPKNIFFLTCDAFGILPPISKLDKNQAMYHFISGYTAKVSGTEMGITTPQTTFSACFGRVFLPLHPLKYAELLGEKLEENPEINVWLVNTGWSGGAYGTGKRIALKHTRTLINSAISGDLNSSTFTPHPIFKISVPSSCPGLPIDMLDPKNTWEDKNDYDRKALELAGLFEAHFAQYLYRASDAIKQAAPLTQIV